MVADHSVTISIKWGWAWLGTKAWWALQMKPMKISVLSIFKGINLRVRSLSSTSIILILNSSPSNLFILVVWSRSCGVSKLDLVIVQLSLWSWTFVSIKDTNFTCPLLGSRKWTSFLRLCNFWKVGSDKVCNCITLWCP